VIKQNESPRRVVPRWHSPAVSATRAETHVPKSNPAGAAASADVERALADWQREGTWRFAGDLMSVAIVSGRFDEAREAASQLAATPSAPMLARAAAGRLLTRVPESQTRMSLRTDDETDARQVGRAIAALRAQTREDPRNALAWVEMARQYTLLGLEDQALRSMEVAVALAPNSRFVLRSAARLLVHADDALAAHRLLLNSSAAPNDPWLVSAEIATASLAERPARLVKQGRLLMDARLPPAHVTELAAALATLELEAGQAKRARRLFTRSIEDPNDNALAQAEWAHTAQRIAIDGLHERLEDAQDSFEAHALEAADGGRTDDAIAEAWKWLYDEPFSSDPALFGSHEAAKAKRFEDGAAFAERGLVANPNQPVLRNNLAFCLARLDRPAQASEQLSKIQRADLDDEDMAFVTATEGLIAYRSGDPLMGRRLYLEAIALTKQKRPKALALLMMAVEESRVKAPDRGETTAIALRAADEALVGEQRGWLQHLGDRTD
jgi:Tfp pilus assembly protein PilF